MRTRRLLSLRNRRLCILAYKHSDIGISQIRVCVPIVICKWGVPKFLCLDQASIGADVRMRLFIKLDNSPNHYLVILATDAGFRFAFIQVRPMETDSGQMSITYMGRLDVKRILGEETRDISGMDVMLTDSE